MDNLHFQSQEFLETGELPVLIRTVLECHNQYTAPFAKGQTLALESAPITDSQFGSHMWSRHKVIKPRWSLPVWNADTAPTLLKIPSFRSVRSLPAL